MLEQLGDEIYLKDINRCLCSIKMCVHIPADIDNIFKISISKACLKVCKVEWGFALCWPQPDLGLASHKVVSREG